MRRLVIVPVATAALLLLAMTPAPLAQETTRAPVFDPAAVVTFEAEILQVSSADLGDGAGLHLLVRNAESQSIEVRVGPEWYLAEQGIELGVGDRIELSAAPVRMDEVPVYVVSSLRKGDQLWVLRDDAGQPGWARANLAAGQAAGGGGMMRGEGMGMGMGMGMMHGQGAARGSGCMMHRQGQATQGRMNGRGMMQGQVPGQGRMQRQGAMNCAAGTADDELGQAAQAAPMCRRDASGTATTAPGESGQEEAAPATASACPCGCAMAGGPAAAR